MAAAILAVFWLFLVASLREKSATMDELGHAAAGYTYWKYNDYRINPENGNLPQRIAGLPLVAAGLTPPSRESEPWRTSDAWRLGYDWFYHVENDADRMLFLGRAVCGLMAVALGALVWHVSRRIFGPVGGILSLVLYVLSPAVLANGALITSDMASALAFFVATMGLWSVLHRITPGRLVFSSLAVAALFLSKMSALLILPVAAVLAIVRLGGTAPLPIAIGRLHRVVSRRGRRALVIAAAAAVHALVIWAAIWAAYGFRYSALPESTSDGGHLAFSWDYLYHKTGPNEVLMSLDLMPEQSTQVRTLLAQHNAVSDDWTYEALRAMKAVREQVLTPAQARRFDALRSEPPPSTFGRTLLALNRHHVLPEAYIFGYAHLWRFSEIRTAFMNGDFTYRGWRTFFPYTFLIKTPLAVFGLAGGAALALVAARRRRQETVPAAGDGGMAYEMIPWAVLWGVYWIAAISSHLNIGHRHILVTYAPLFVFCGANARWLGGGVGSREVAGASIRPSSAAVLVLMLLLAIEVVPQYPNFLAYFNVLGGGAGHGYQHLVDSSLDWGQDLRAVKRVIETSDRRSPAYLSYFGVGSPAYYRIPARSFHSLPGLDDTPAIKALDLPARDAIAQLREEVRTHPDYDPDMVGHTQTGDRMRAVLVKKASALRLGAGTYFVSATLLQPVSAPLDGPFGPWNSRYEATYQQLLSVVRPLMSDDPSVRRRAMMDRMPEDWQTVWSTFDEYRFARFTAFLRQREPDGNVNGSILIYRLTDAEITQALEGAPAELGADVPRRLEQRYGPLPR